MSPTLKPSWSRGVLVYAIPRRYSGEEGGAAASAGCPAAPTSPEPAVHAPPDCRPPTMSFMQVPGRSTLAPACPGPERRAFESGRAEALKLGISFGTINPPISGVGPSVQTSVPT
jgi:hypothetical protein